MVGQLEKHKRLLKAILQFANCKFKNLKWARPTQLANPVGVGVFAENYPSVLNRGYATCCHAARMQWVGGWVGHFAKHLSLRSECSVRRSIEWKIELNVLRQPKATSKTSKCSPCLANYVMLCFSIEWTSMGGHSGPQNVNGALEFGLNTKRFSTFDSWLYQVVLFDLLHSSDLDFSLSFSRKSP